MPIDPGTTTPIFLSSFLGNDQTGSSISQLSTSLALGLFQYMQAGISVTSIDAGTLGTGTGLCPTIQLPQPLILAALAESFAGHGILGTMMPAQANSIATAISSSLSLAIAQTLNPTVGVGAGKLQLIPNGSGTSIFLAAFIQGGLLGSQSARYATSISLALDTVISSAIGIVTVIGSPSIIASSGLGFGRIL